MSDPFPDDAENLDREEIKKMMDQWMSAAYPDFEPQIIHTLDKDYYLPALKVLVRNSAGFFSPSKVAEWVDGELVAECYNVHFRTYYSLDNLWGNAVEIERTAQPYVFLDHADCECGIYGSVNLEEIRSYRDVKSTTNAFTSPPKGKLTLCIIEPSEGADVLVCRKGWRASKAFISEIVGETINVSEASQLLSLAWGRELDVRRVYESR